MQLGHLEKLCRTRLEDVLVEEGALEREKVEFAQAEQERTGKQLGQILVESEILPEYDLAKIVVTHYPLPFIDLAGYTTRREVMALLPADFCERWSVLPLDQFGATLTLAVCEMPPMEVIEDIAQRTKLLPTLFVGARRALHEALAGGAKSAAGAKQAAKRATVVGAVPAAAAKPQASAKAAASAAPTVAPASSGADEVEEGASGPPFPDLVLPRVQMSLAGGAPGAPKAPPPPARPGSRSTIVPRAAAPTPAPTAAATAAGLGWMDSAANAPAPSQHAKASVTKFKFAGGGAAQPAAAKTTGGAKPDGKGGAWESIFDVGEAVVKRETQGGAKPPPSPAK